MSGIGLPELVIIIVIVALMFGAPIVTFFVGYLVGKNRSSAGDTAATVAPTPAPAPALDQEPAAESPVPAAEEPADE